MYGRARRIALVKYIIIILVVILVLYVLFTKIFVEKVFVDSSDDINYLREYLQSTGYLCEVVKDDTSNCSYKKDNLKKTFIKYSEGFNYVLESTSYRIIINYVPTENNKIVLKTNSNSLVGYRNKVYNCKTKGDLFGEIDNCSTVQGDVLDVETYIGEVEKSQNEIKRILNASGYDVEFLLNTYDWQS